MDHKNLYNSEYVSRDYGKRDYLEPAEETLITQLGHDRLAAMDMLDMGVGGGRTTKYFAPLVRHYIGADYAPAMLEVCKKRYGGDFSFIECDVRKMDIFKDNSFDFVLFSFNGIDSFSHKDRTTALKEVWRVLRDDGIFYFSSHNLNWSGLKGLFTIKNNLKKILNSGKSANSENKSPLRYAHKGAKAACRVIRLNLLNKAVGMEGFIDKLKKEGRGNIYDNSLNGKASIYYVTAKEQKKQLAQSGFIDILSYSRGGINTNDEEQLNQGGWVYYYCRADKS